MPEGSPILLGSWWHSVDHDEPCRVVDAEVLWNQATCLVWLPRRATTVRTLQDRLVPLKTSDSGLLDRLSFTSAAARIADALEHDALISPFEGSVIPLPQPAPCPPEGHVGRPNPLLAR